MTGYFKSGAWIEIPKIRLPIRIELIENRVRDIEHVVCLSTKTHIDIHYRSPSQVIVIGRYRNHDHIRAYTVENDYLPLLIEELKRMEKLSTIGRIDAPIEFKACYMRD